MTIHVPIPARILPRVGQLLRLLASDQDNEALAACRALKKTLKGASVDLNDLAATIEHPAPAQIIYVDRPAEPPPPPPPPPRQPERPADNPYVSISKPMRAQIIRVLNSALKDPTTGQWERDFIESILPRIEAPKGRITQRQFDIVERITSRMDRKAANAA